MSLFALLSALCTFVALRIDYQRKIRCIHHSILSTLSALLPALLKFEGVGADSNLFTIHEVLWQQYSLQAFLCNGGEAFL